jgi:hypothetical protein
MRLILFILLVSINAFALAIEIKEPVRITQSNTTYTNETLFLAPRANCPVLIIGNDLGPIITNVLVRYVTIDGNKDKQTTELFANTILGPINNNGILIQNAKGVTIQNVTIKNCRSGGLVTTHFVTHLLVDNLITYNNYFDGIACYQTLDSEFGNILSYSNNAAGLSFDLMFNRNNFKNVLLANNGIGIFMRDSNFNTFTNLAITHTTLFEIFIAQVDKNTNTGCSYNKFFNVKLEKGIVYTNDSSCVGNVIK